MSNGIYIVADDGLLYLNPVMAGVVDENLIEFFISFSNKEPPEVVIERIKNYPPHRGITAPGLWAWYAKAADTILRQLGFQFINVRKSLACQRVFCGKDQKGRRMEKALSFFFDLMGPVPAEQITKHDGTQPCPPDRPEGAYGLPAVKPILSLDQILKAGKTPPEPQEPPDQPRVFEEEMEERTREISGPDAPPKLDPEISGPDALNQA